MKRRWTSSSSFLVIQFQHQDPGRQRRLRWNFSWQAWGRIVWWVVRFLLENSFLDWSRYHPLHHRMEYQQWNTWGSWDRRGLRLHGCRRFRRIWFHPWWEVYKFCVGIGRRVWLRWFHRLDSEEGTSGKGEIELDDVVGLFIEIESVGFDVGEGAGFIEILFDHFEESGSFRFGGERVNVSTGETEGVTGELDHWQLRYYWN